MKKIATIACMAMITGAAYGQPLNKKLDSLMEYYYKHQNFNGVVFAAKGGEVLLNRGYGYKDIAKKSKHDEHTIFQIGSNTKQFTAEIILQLAMKQKLSLTDPITKFFPGYPNGERIYVENLLTHTSGIYDYTTDSVWRVKVAEPKTKDQMMSLFRDKPLDFEPGSKYDYSNSNYILLGYIIEQVTGKPYEQVVREQIFVPCGMTHSGFDFANLKDKNKATGYYGIDGEDFVPAPITDSTQSAAAGALYSTTGDMNKWHKALQTYKLLPKEWQEKAYHPFKDKYAYGWFIDSLDGRRAIKHSGGIPGFISYELRVEEDDLDIVVLQNQMSTAADQKQVATNIAHCIYKKDYKLPEPPKAMAVGTDVLKRYEGDYALTPDFIMNVMLKGDGLYAQATGQGAIKILPETETMFFCKEVNAKIEFVSENGVVNKLILHQNGQHVPAVKK